MIQVQFPNCRLVHIKLAGCRRVCTIYFRQVCTRASVEGSSGWEATLAKTNPGEKTHIKTNKQREATIAKTNPGGAFPFYL